MATTYDNVPSWPAGHKVTAAEALIVTNLLEAGGPNGGLYSEQVFYRTSTLTRASTTTLTDDTVLTCTLLANAVYDVSMVLFYYGQTGVLFKTGWTVPSGVAGNRCCLGPGSNASDANADNMAMHSGVHNFGTAITYGTRGATTNQLCAIESAIVVTGASGGTLALQWAQATSSATASGLGTGSKMTVKRLA